MPNNHIPALTGLRFFAAFWVVGFHYFSFSGNLSFLNPIFSVGHLGVPFFFILSGFIIALNYTEREFSFRQFFILRMARVAPMYYLALFLALPLLYLTWKNSNSLPELGGQVFINLTMLHTLLPIKAFTQGWNTPAWSISAELFFYLLFPFIKAKKLGPFKDSFKNLIFLFLISFLLDFMKMGIPDSFTLFGKAWECNFKGFIFFRMVNFLIGINLYYVYRDYFLQINKYDMGNFSLFISIVLLSFISFIPKNNIHAENPFIIIIFSSFILLNASSIKLNTLYNKKVWIFLGEASYSLYILQAPLKFYAQQLYTKVFGVTLTSGFLYSFYLSIVLITLSCLFFTYVEKPARHYIKNKFVS